MKGLYGLMTLACLAAGCGGNAKLEMAAADALLASADQIEVAVVEYHNDLSRGDDDREAAVISAFVKRVREDSDNQTVVDSHVADFKSVLERIRTDRETAARRRGSAMSHVEAVREVANGLQRLAVQSLTLEDEMKRYLSDWIDTRKKANKETTQ